MTVVKVIELAGTSPVSWEQAMNEVVDRACKTLKNVSSMKIRSQSAEIKDGKIVNYQVVVDVAFMVE